MRWRGRGATSGYCLLSPHGRLGGSSVATTCLQASIPSVQGAASVDKSGIILGADSPNRRISDADVSYRASRQRVEFYHTNQLKGN